MANPGLVALAAISGLLGGFSKGRQDRQEMELKQQQLQRQEARDNALQDYQMSQANKAPDMVRTFQFMQGLPPDQQKSFLNLNAAHSPYVYDVGPGGAPAKTMVPGYREPPKENDDERYIRLSNTVASKGAGNLSPGEKTWLITEKRKRDKTAGY